MKSYLLYLLLALLPLASFAQSRSVSFGMGYDEFRLPYMERASWNAEDDPVWKSRLHLELAYETISSTGFQQRNRVAIGLDAIPRHLSLHDDHENRWARNMRGGLAISYMHDFGYSKQFAEGRFGFAMGAGLGLHLLVREGGFVSNLPPAPVDAPYTASIDYRVAEFGPMIQPYLALTYRPLPNLTVSLEQRHELAGLLVHVREWNNANYFDPTLETSDLTSRFTLSSGRSVHYMPPLVRVGYTF